MQEFKKNAYEQAKKFDVDLILPHYEKIYNHLVGKVVA